MPTHNAMQAAVSSSRIDLNAEFKSPRQGPQILIVEDDIEIARMSVGSVVEGLIANVDLPVVEDSARRAGVVAALLRETPTEARGAVLAAATRAGFDFKILPREQISTIPDSYLQWRSIGWLLQIESGSIPGRWIRIGRQYAFVIDLDQQSVLAHFGMIAMASTALVASTTRNPCTRR